MDNLLSAWQSILSNKVRSILTVLGVVIGVASVTTLISLGQGLQNDVSSLIQGFGTNVITIISGKIDTSTGSQANTNPAAFVAGDILTLDDVGLIEKNDQIEAVSPLALVAGNLKFGDKTTSPTLFGAYPSAKDAFQILSIDRGKMFDTKSSGNVVILGPNTTKDLFGDTDPIGQKVALGTEQFEVVGTFAKAKSGSIFGSQFDTVTMIPFDTATKLNKDTVKIYRIVAKAKDTAKVDEVKKALKDSLLTQHKGEEDFTVLTQDDLLGLFNTFLTLATTMVSAIASISLIVGGIGIMNIMLVTVTERTREIGLRKAVGATRTAILWQFLTEAVMVTLVGAVIGLAISFAISAVITFKTELTPAITPTVILTAAGISIVIGVIFGLWPALRAANKDPIEALRYE